MNRGTYTIAASTLGFEPPKRKRAVWENRNRPARGRHEVFKETQKKRDRERRRA